MKKIITFCCILVGIVLSNSAFAGGGRLCDSSIESCPNLVISTSTPTVKEWTKVTFNWKSTNGVACRIGNSLVTSGTFTRTLYQTQNVYFACSVADYSSSARSNNIKVIVNPIVISGTLFTSKEEITIGQRIRVKWDIKNAEQCWLNGNKVPAKKSYIDTPQASRSYYLYCTNGRKKYTLINNLKVVPKKVTANFRVSKTEILKGQAVRLYWNSVNTTHCTIDWQKHASKGSILVRPTHSQYYKLSCTGNGGTERETFFITVKPKQVSLTLTASKTSIIKGQAVRIRWKSTNATSCIVNWESSPVSGNILLKPEFSQYYRVSCSWDTSKAETIFIKVTPKTVTPTPPVVPPVYVHPSITFTTDTTFIKLGENTVIRWQASQWATSCTTDWNNSKKVKWASRVSPTSLWFTNYRVTCKFNNWPHPVSATTVVHTK